MFAALKSGGAIPAALSPSLSPAPSEERPAVATNEATKASVNGMSNGSANGASPDAADENERTVQCLGVPEGSEDVELKEHFASCGEVSRLFLLPLRV